LRIVANPQARVVEEQSSPSLRGINLAGPEFGSPVDEPSSTFSNEEPGVAGAQYSYPTRQTLAGLAARGVGFVRLPVRWERLQPQLGGELNAAESGRLLATAESALAAGLDLIVDVHNYGAYYLADPAGGRGIRRPIGSADVTVADFADLWRRLSTLLRGQPAVIGYGLMNEPVALRTAGVWEAASRAAAAAIRANGDERRIFVQPYGWGGVGQFAEYHASGPWIAEPNVWYEAHQYFDADSSARYVASYDAELARASRRRP
jgi:endoglucanase